MPIGPKGDPQAPSGPRLSLTGLYAFIYSSLNDPKAIIGKNGWDELVICERLLPWIIIWKPSKHDLDLNVATDVKTHICLPAKETTQWAATKESSQWHIYRRVNTNEHIWMKKEGCIEGRDITLCNVKVFLLFKEGLSNRQASSSDNQICYWVLYLIVKSGMKKYLFANRETVTLSTGAKTWADNVYVPPYAHMGQESLLFAASTSYN